MRQQAAVAAPISSSVISGEPTVAGEGSDRSGGRARSGAKVVEGKPPPASRSMLCGSSIAGTRKPQPRGGIGVSVRTGETRDLENPACEESAIFLFFFFSNL